MHVIEVLFGISLHLKCNEFIKFRKRNRSAKAKPDCIVHTEKTCIWASSEAETFIFVHIIYI